MFTLDYSVKMFDTDASGFLFFTSQMRMAHEAYEAFLASANLGISSILRSGNYLLPIVHAETDYRSPAGVGDRVQIQIRLERLGETSFTLFYRFLQPDGREVGTARTVHVAVATANHQKTALPEELRRALKKLE
jgi:1,4-dihydroxy-2-naphthoyl-CoA hydrolase